MMKMASGDDSPLRQGAETGLDWFFEDSGACSGGIPDLGYFLEVSVFIGIFGIGLTSGGFLTLGARPRGAPSTLVVASGLLSDIFSFQYFLYFPKIFSVNFQLVLRTFISAQKNNTTVVLLKTTSVQVSSIQIIPKPYKIVVNMA